MPHEAWSVKLDLTCKEGAASNSHSTARYQLLPKDSNPPHTHLCR